MTEPWQGISCEEWIERTVESFKPEFPEEIVEKITQLLLSDYDDEYIQTKVVKMLGQSSKSTADTFIEWRDQIVKYFQVKYREINQAKANAAQSYIPVKRLKPKIPVVKSKYHNTETINASRFDVEATTLPKPVVEHKKLTDLPVWVQQCFPNCVELNDIQSQIFETAFNSNDNMLVLAPTGAGKTNVALLTILHEIKKHLIDIPGIPPHLDDSQFLIVYITPMKALAMEIQDKLSNALKHLKINVEEYTGDTSLTSTELERSHILVATPEKWDIATRKAGENAPCMRLKLLIIDEIHLLADERGPVIESLVARTLRQVEQTQNMIRILGLSATLPNYTDVANFIRVPDSGLFYFGPEYRPVPLAMTLIGAKKTDKTPNEDMQKLYNELIGKGAKKDSIQVDIVGIQVLNEILPKQQQIIIFVHSRNETSRYAHLISRYCKVSVSQEMIKLAGKKNLSPQLKDVIGLGVGIHHAGLPRTDRIFMEEMFRSNMIQILVCTATLAWGVNLPAHTVIIKGTKVYNSELGRIEDIGILDVHQMFGRAGRPQFDTCGEAFLITENKVLTTYTRTLVNAESITSRFMNKLEDFLNAEVSLGTVASRSDAIAWATYTFMYQLNPDHSGTESRVDSAIKNLKKYGMVKYSKSTEVLHPTHVGLVSSMHYIPFDSVRFLKEEMKGDMEEGELIDCVFSSGIVDNMAVRKSEYKEMEMYKPVIPFASAIEEVAGKTSFLMQTYISRENLKTTTLQLEQGWVAENISRIFDAIYEISVERGWCFLASFSLDLCKMVENRMWWCRNRTDCPLKQIMTFPKDDPLLRRIEMQGLSVDDLKVIKYDELRQMLRSDKLAQEAIDMAKKFPSVKMDATYQPITDKIINIVINAQFPFEWDYNICGNFMQFKIFIEDGNENAFYIASDFSIYKTLAKEGIVLEYCVPVALESRSYVISITSSKYLAASDRITMKIDRFIKPFESFSSDLLKLKPLPVSAINDYKYINFFDFKYFNELQTQLFFQVYHTDENILVCAPNGTGKSVIAEIAIIKMLIKDNNGKCLYINPLQSSIDEKFSKWNNKFNVCNLTGDLSSDSKKMALSRVIIGTPDKVDNVTKIRSLKFIFNEIKLVIIDDAHMMNSPRGALIEVIFSRMLRFASKARVVVLSNTIANPIDFAIYFGVNSRQTFNFPLESRPVRMRPLMRGFPGRNYSARMAAMNKPLSDSIQHFANGQPTIVFVSSKKQVKLTASELLDYANNRGEPFYYQTEESTKASEKIEDSELAHFLEMGVGIHHSGLPKNDQLIVEELFKNGHLKLLVAPVSFAWGRYLPAKFVVIKGTEYWDAKTNQYVPYPMNDMQQMMSRAGRPNIDTEGLIMILCEESRKEFLQNFVYTPIPVESFLGNILPIVLSNEIANRNIKCMKDLYSFLSGTFLKLRIGYNPKYYGKTLTRFVEDSIDHLINDKTIIFDNKGIFHPTQIGRISALYNVHPRIINTFNYRSFDASAIDILLKAVCQASDLSGVSYRFGDDKILSEMKPRFSIKDPLTQSYTKAFYILQYYLSNREMPSQDFEIDAPIIVEKVIKIAKCFAEICSIKGLLDETLNCLSLIQMLSFGIWHDANPVQQLVDFETFQDLYSKNLHILPQIIFSRAKLPQVLHELRMNVPVYKKSRCFINKTRTAVRIQLELISGRIGSQIITKIPDFQNILQSVHILICHQPQRKVYAHTRIVLDKKEITTVVECLSPLPTSDIWIYMIPEYIPGLDQIFPLSPSDADRLKPLQKNTFSRKAEPIKPIPTTQITTQEVEANPDSKVRTLFGKKRVQPPEAIVLGRKVQPAEPGSANKPSISMPRKKEQPNPEPQQQSQQQQVVEIPPVAEDQQINEQNQQNDGEIKHNENDIQTDETNQYVEENNNIGDQTIIEENQNLDEQHEDDENQNVYRSRIINENQKVSLYEKIEEYENLIDEFEVDEEENVNEAPNAEDEKEKIKIEVLSDDIDEDDQDDDVIEVVRPNRMRKRHLEVEKQEHLEDENDLPQLSDDEIDKLVGEEIDLNAEITKQEEEKHEETSGKFEEEYDEDYNDEDDDDPFAKFNDESTDDYNMEDDYNEFSDDELKDNKGSSKKTVEEELIPKKEHIPIPVEMFEVPIAKTIQEISSEQNIPIEVETINVTQTEPENNEEEDVKEEEEEDLYEEYEEEIIEEEEIKEKVEEKVEPKQEAPKIDLLKLKNEIDKIKNSHQRTMDMAKPRTSTLVVVNNPNEPKQEEIKQNAIVVEIKHKASEEMPQKPPPQIPMVEINKRQQPEIPTTERDGRKKRIATLVSHDDPNYDPVKFLQSLDTQAPTSKKPKQNKNKNKPATLIVAGEDPNYDPVAFLNSLDTKPPRKKQNKKKPATLVVGGMDQTVPNKPKVVLESRRKFKRNVEVVQKEKIDKENYEVIKKKIIVRLGGKQQVDSPVEFPQQRRERNQYVTRSGERIQRSRDISSMRHMHSSSDDKSVQIGKKSQKAEPKTANPISNENPQPVVEPEINEPLRRHNNTESAMEYQGTKFEDTIDPQLIVKTQQTQQTSNTQDAKPKSKTQQRKEANKKFAVWTPPKDNKQEETQKQQQQPKQEEKQTYQQKQEQKQKQNSQQIQEKEQKQTYQQKQEVIRAEEVPVVHYAEWDENDHEEYISAPRSSRSRSRGGRH